MKLIDEKKKITLSELESMAQKMFGNLVKAVVDIQEETASVDAELHADEEAHLLEHGSNQKNLWGINLYPALTGDDFIEFDSMINLRPSQGNKSRSVEDKEIQQKIIKIINKIVQR